jgi:uncharacterized coiled-coil protein SlyX
MKLDITRHFPWNRRRSSSLAQILAGIDRLEKQMSKLDDQISALTAQVQANTDVENSALVLIQGFSARLDAAVAAAQAAGATPTQLQALTDLGTAIKTSDDSLAAAVAANTAPPAV